MAARGFDDRYAGALGLQWEGPELVVVGFQPPVLAYQHAFSEPPPQHGLPWVNIARFDARAGSIEIWPITIYPPKERFLQPRFKRLRSILFEGYEMRLPQDSGDVEDCLDVLPSGFFRQAQFGLGLPKVLLPIVKEIERVRDVTRLVISQRRPTRVEGDTLVLAHDQYESAALFLQRVADRHQRRSLEERHAYARNQLVTPLDPRAYPEERPPYAEDTVFEILNVMSAAKLKLSQKDKTSLLREVTKHTSDLSAETPEALFRLHREIELVNLDALIENFRTLLGRTGRREKQWQRLFELNPFLLSMVFGYPIVVVMREATVGGPLLDGRGAKIADFPGQKPDEQQRCLGGA